MYRQSMKLKALSNNYPIKMKRLLFFLFSIIITLSVNSQTEIFPSGSYIINMGTGTQTIANGLKPYGLVYELLKTHHVPIKWIIGSGKAKDGKDFTYEGVDYKGGTFIISSDFISSAIRSRIDAWSSTGVVGKYTTIAINLNVTQTLTSVPNWTLNPVNVAISKSFFTDAGIPSSAYVSANAAGLGACNDIFVMPHADPTWANHGNLYNWNRNHLGAIWAGCHAVSVLESLVNPSNGGEQMNFLTTKGLLNYNSHNDGSAPFSYFFNRANYNGLPISARPDDAVFQMMGNEDAAHTNGSEQVYIPSVGSSWRNTTHIGCYDSIQSNVNANSSNGPAAVTLYGRGFGLNTSGYVMYQGGHDIEGSNEANIAAVRQFFNFSLMVMIDKAPKISSIIIPKQIQEGTTYNLSINASSPVGSNLSYEWIATCPGIFGSINSKTTTFTPNNLNKNNSYTITCIVTDGCARYTFNSAMTTGMAALPVSIIKLTVSKNNDNAKIEWTTVNEYKLENFEIYRSLDGYSFDNVGNQLVLQNTTEVKSYLFEDKNIVNLGISKVYYKLKVINTDGSYQWSGILKLQLDEKVKSSEKVEVFPNPFTNDLFLEFETLPEKEFTLYVLDANGNNMLIANNPILSQNLYKIDVSNLPKGLYFVYLNFVDGTKISNKIIKN
jgi:hypothetical protein